MTKEIIIFEKVKELKKELENYSSLTNDSLWKDIYDKIDKVYKILLKDKRIYGW